VLMQLYQDHFQTEAEGKPDSEQLMEINKRLTFMLNLMYEQGFNRQVDRKATANSKLDSHRQSKERLETLSPRGTIEDQVTEEQELQEKLNRFDGEHCYSREEAAMKALAYELEKLKMSPEAFFRLADMDNTGQVSP